MPSSKVLSIDPGNVESGWAVIDSVTCKPITFDKSNNLELLGFIYEGVFGDVDEVAIEMVASYGMAVGATVFDTCVWIGRFREAFCWHTGLEPEMIFRKDVKLHHCGVTSAKDSNIRQALVDRFDPEASNSGKGTKAEPGFFYGFRADIWQAFALSVLVADRIEGRQGVNA